MASIQQKIADSLSVLKNFQDTNDCGIVKGMKTLGETHTKRLIENGYLEQVIKGWYMPTMPGMEGDTTAWYASYWKFIVAYSNNRFADNWCLTPEESLDFYAGDTTAPNQLIIRSTKASNNIVNLMHGTSLLDISASMPKQVVIESKYGIRLYSLAEALVYCTPTYFTHSSVNARTCLFLIKSADEILRLVADEGNSSRTSRLVGAFRNIGRADIADNMVQVMTRLGHGIRPTDPFEDEVPAIFGTDVNNSPFAVRINLMWQEMKKQILAMEIKRKTQNLSVDAVLSMMDENYVQDSYHSLSIEGYRVTERLIDRVRSGEWNPENDNFDSDRRNALAARGYFQAFQYVKESVREIINGTDAGKVVGRDYDKWHFELFQPCISAGIIKPSDLIGYRLQQVYIRGSRHTPVSPEALRDVMPMYVELMESEENALVRAVLGHFFFVYIHPYMDGNGRTARFIMNVMLVTNGLPWKVITVKERDSYMSALEKASIQGDITDFAKIILS